MRQRRIRVTGNPKQEIDLDLLAQAILSIVEQQLTSTPKDQRAHGGSGDAA